MPTTHPVAVLTGAGSGIGRATAIMLAQRGYALVLVGRTRSALTETAGLTGASERIEVVGGNVADPFQCKHMIARAVERFGRLDALINNAGYAPLEPIDRSTPELIEETYRVNALAPAWAIHHAWPILARQHAAAPADAKPRTAIVNISTLGTLDPFPGFFAYASAKASVNLMVASVAKEGKAMGVRAFAIAPGAVETGMLRSIFPASKLPASQCLAPEDVARVIVECVVGERDAQNGRVIPVVPPPMTAWLAKWKTDNPAGQVAP